MNDRLEDNNDSVHSQYQQLSTVEQCSTVSDWLSERLRRRVEKRKPFLLERRRKRKCGRKKKPFIRAHFEYLQKSKHKKQRFMSFDAARIEARKVNCTNITQWIDWHKKHNVKSLPRYPDHVYLNEWQGWGDWLGFYNPNPFIKRDIIDNKQYREFWSAVQWAQKIAAKYDIETAQQWYLFTREYELPDDIPLYPSHIYKQWEIYGGWNVWLGKDLRSKIMSEQNVVPVFGLATDIQSFNAGNIIHVLIEKDGLPALKQTLNENRLQLVANSRVYVYEPEQRDRLMQVLQLNGKLDSTGEKWTITNVSNLLFECDSIFQWYQPPQIGSGFAG